jgi:hypothetical protein
MAQTPGDDKTEPSLELPSMKLPGFRRRRKAEPDEPAESARPDSTTPEPSVEEPTHEFADPGTTPGRSLPRLSGRAAAALTGAVVGAGGTAATVGALAACEAVRGVSTCGGAPGFFVLVAILALMVLSGALLLKAWQTKDPGSTSFLAVGIVAVVAMLVLLDVIDSPWMFLVIPALGAASYLLAHWVATRFDDEDTGRRDWS